MTPEEQRKLMEQRMQEMGGPARAPRVGDIVHTVVATAWEGSQGPVTACYAAIVTGPFEESTVYTGEELPVPDLPLMVMPPPPYNAPFPVSVVENQREHNPDTWHWPSPDGPCG